MLDLAPRVGELSEDEFRSALREFLTSHHPGTEPEDPDERLLLQRAWAACLHDHGWAAPSWPRQWGGMELPVDKLVPYYEELALARVPAHPSPNAFIVGPTILAFGTPWQQERFLLPIVRGEELWCQGFSERGAVSDLPSLLTRAELAGNEYIGERPEALDEPSHGGRLGCSPWSAPATSVLGSEALLIRSST